MGRTPEPQHVVSIDGQEIDENDPNFRYRSSVETTTGPEVEGQDGVDALPLEDDLGLVIDAPEGFNKPAGDGGRSSMMDQGQS
ncbi:hypothetical protein ACFXDJ_18205 [Streptomyces sp. NPDC059443]|uniref:hypothetical protein n=1 Tax=unclassified Streptomyces TaxID=2593676 RepID=UPI0036A451C9